MAAPGAGNASNAGNGAAGNGPPPPDPFTTPINVEMPAAQMEQIRTALATEQARLREETDRQRAEANRLQMEKAQIEGLSEYHNRRRPFTTRARPGDGRDLAAAFNTNTNSSGRRGKWTCGLATAPGTIAPAQVAAA